MPRAADDCGIPTTLTAEGVGRPARPGEWLEYSPILSILVAGMLAGYLVRLFRMSPNGALAALDLNTYNLIFLVLGLLLHWRPILFLRSAMESIPFVGGVLLQFPF